MGKTIEDFMHDDKYYQNKLKKIKKINNIKNKVHSIESKNNDIDYNSLTNRLKRTAKKVGIALAIGTGVFILGYVGTLIGKKEQDYSYETNNSNNNQNHKLNDLNKEIIESFNGLEKFDSEYMKQPDYISELSDYVYKRITNSPVSKINYMESSLYVTILDNLEIQSLVKKKCEKYNKLESTKNKIDLDNIEKLTQKYLKELED